MGHGAARKTLAVTLPINIRVNSLRQCEDITIRLAPSFSVQLTMAAWGAGIDHLGRFQHSPASASSHEDDFRAVFDGMQCRTSRRRCFCSIA